MARIKKRSTSSTRPSEPQLMGAVHQASDYYSGHRKMVLLITAAVVVVAALIISFITYQSLRDRKASPLFSAAYEYYKPSDGTPPDYQKALELFRDIQKTYPRTMSGATAQFFVANSLMNLGRTDHALGEYEAFVKRYQGRKELLGLVHQRMGYIYRGQGKSDDSVRSFQRSEELLGTGLATVELARLYGQAGKTEESQKKYKAVMEGLPNSQWAFEAMTKLPPPAQPAPEGSLAPPAVQPEKKTESK
jgi:tetratricopeptide (TPR) repeat protein